MIPFGTWRLYNCSIYWIGQESYDQTSHFKAKKILWLSPSMRTRVPRSGWHNSRIDAFARDRWGQIQGLGARTNQSPVLAASQPCHKQVVTHSVLYYRLPRVSGREKQMNPSPHQSPHKATELKKKFKTLMCKIRKDMFWRKTKSLMFWPSPHGEARKGQSSKAVWKGSIWKVFSASPQAIPTVSKDFNKGSIRYREKRRIQNCQQKFRMNSPPLLFLTACFF